jgi:hypothetical protein
VHVQIISNWSKDHAVKASHDESLRGRHREGDYPNEWSTVLVTALGS